ncbi:phosphatidylserine decarboxylase proenzyme [Verticillium dahliae VdLs.17]|uniref:phosphatidylserine decarboxylase n=1 Tax=Verticillium dahliae (strain VdLs.17 / ATCC MYA-4575 / FGSC 10137) TaxID=498257 RepID=G2WXL4_VERDV|nr:phosphatidylserine decarboxylase proenzyme [Verticillium dahliae VdLs.17]EGY20822.1 phosphatidylserine decarboxylase proenzyme [Verticillium dahliae VdLs.17]
MWFLSTIHAIVDYVMSWAHMAQNCEFGYPSLNRKTGRLEREQQLLLKKIKLILLFNPITEWIDTTHAMRLYIHNKSVASGRDEGTPASKKQIKTFVEAFNIDMGDFEPSNIGDYDTFEDFFTRAHKPGSRPIHEKENPSKATVVADSRVVVYGSLAMAKTLWIKGRDFNISNLAMDTQLGESFTGSAVASFRLSPQDYHRYHSPVAGTIKLFRSVPGDYYQVDPIALHSDVDILTRNRRQYVLIETKEFGDVLFVAIGATEVGTVQIHDQWQKHGAKIQKGDELGFFQFGGSSIIVAFQHGRIEFDQDLLDLSKQQIQVSVEVGMSLGRALRAAT